MKESPFYQEILQECLQEGEVTLLMRLLVKRFGDVSESIQSRLTQATIADFKLWSDRILEAKNLTDTYSCHIKDEVFLIANPALLSNVVEQIDQIPMGDRDTKGDLYEYMRSLFLTIKKKWALLIWEMNPLLCNFQKTSSN